MSIFPLGCILYKLCRKQLNNRSHWYIFSNIVLNFSEIFNSQQYMNNYFVKWIKYSLNHSLGLKLSPWQLVDSWNTPSRAPWEAAFKINGCPEHRGICPGLR